MIPISSSVHGWAMDVGGGDHISFGFECRGSPAGELRGEQRPWCSTERDASRAALVGHERTDEHSSAEEGTAPSRDEADVEGELLQRLDRCARDLDRPLGQIDGRPRAGGVVAGVEGDVTPDEGTVELPLDGEGANRVRVVLPEQVDRPPGSCRFVADREGRGDRSGTRRRSPPARAEAAVVACPAGEPML